MIAQRLLQYSFALWAVLGPLLSATTSSSDPTDEWSSDDLYSSEDLSSLRFSFDRAAQITRHSYFHQNYRLGFKIELVCIAYGKPVPTITWYKDGKNLRMKYSMSLDEKLKNKEHTLKSKLEIDPASVGDAGVYTCLVNNIFNTDQRTFKVTFTLGDSDFEYMYGNL